MRSIKTAGLATAALALFCSACFEQRDIEVELPEIDARMSGYSSRSGCQLTISPEATLPEEKPLIEEGATLQIESLEAELDFLAQRFGSPQVVHDGEAYSEWEFEVAEGKILLRRKLATGEGLRLWS